jgi:hypothetical protein
MNQNNSLPVVETILNELRTKEIQSALQQLKGLETILSSTKASTHLIEQRLQALETNTVPETDVVIAEEKSESESKQQDMGKKKPSRAKKTIK